MILYHLTKSKNLDSILEKGLIAGKRKGLTTNIKQNKVFLTNDIIKVIKYQAGDEWCKRHKAIVLKIEFEEGYFGFQHVHYRSNGTYVLSDFEFVVSHIPKENIVEVIGLKEFLNLNK